MTTSFTFSKIRQNRPILYFWSTFIYSKCLIWIFQFLHFPSIFVLLKLACLVPLVDGKIQVFKNSPKLAIFGIFDELLYTQNANVVRFARNVQWDFFCDFQTPFGLVDVDYRLFDFFFCKCYSTCKTPSSGIIIAVFPNFHVCILSFIVKIRRGVVAICNKIGKNGFSHLELFLNEKKLWQKKPFKSRKSYCHFLAFAELEFWLGKK